LLLEFLSKCPFAQDVRPGSLIRKILLNIDEDAHLIGEGRDKQGLQRANKGESEYQRQPRRTQRNVLMRKCWKALLTMPHLRSLEVHIMPVEDLLPARGQILRSEGRSVICIQTLGQGVLSIRIPLRIERKQVSVNWYLRGIHESELLSRFRILGSRHFIFLPNLC
jgi:hypothetical protein